MSEISQPHFTIFDVTGGNSVKEYKKIGAFVRIAILGLWLNQDALEISRVSK